jgi:hypothetical protein
MNLEAPPEIAKLYSASDGWARDMPWHRSSRAEHFETTYSIEGAQKVRVYLHKSYVQNETAAPWEIARQIKAAVNAARRFQGKRGQKEGRRSRPGKRVRERQRHEREQLDAQQSSGVCCAAIVGSGDPQR